MHAAAGTECDDGNIAKIMQTVEALPELHAVVLVANGSNARLTTDVLNTFTLLKGLLPDAVLRNVIAIVTNCTFLTWCVAAGHLVCRYLAAWCLILAVVRSNLQLSNLPVVIKPEHVLYMQNSAFSSDPERYVTCTRLQQLCRAGGGVACTQVDTQDCWLPRSGSRVAQVARHPAQAHPGDSQPGSHQHNGLQGAWPLHSFCIMTFS